MASDGALGGGSGRPASVLPGLLTGAAMAVLLLGLGGPSLVGALVALPGVAAMSQVRAGDALSPERYDQAAGALAESARFWPDGSLEADRGYLFLRRAEAMEPGETRDRAYRAAIDATQAGLASAPAQPSAWARLAYLELRQGNRPASLAALRMSLITGSVVPELMTSRLEIGLRLAALFDAAMVGLMKRQIRLIWILKPEYVTQLSADPSAADFVRAALAELDEADMREFIRQNRR